MEIPQVLKSSNPSLQNASDFSTLFRGSTRFHTFFFVGRLGNVMSKNHPHTALQTGKIWGYCGDENCFNRSTFPGIGRLNLVSKHRKHIIPLFFNKSTKCWGKCSVTYGNTKSHSPRFWWRLWPPASTRKVGAVRLGKIQHAYPSSSSSLNIGNLQLPVANISGNG